MQGVEGPDRELWDAGLATPLGAVSPTGIAGLTLGGGLGWLNGKHGLTCDNRVSDEVVTANDEVLRASAEDNPDLFWALRGGSSNFGVVTLFTYRLHPIGPVLAGGLSYPWTPQTNPPSPLRAAALLEGRLVAAPDRRGDRDHGAVRPAYPVGHQRRRAATHGWRGKPRRAVRDRLRPPR